MDLRQTAFFRRRRKPMFKEIVCSGSAKRRTFVNLLPAQVDALDALAARGDTSRSSLARKAVAEFLRDNAPNNVAEKTEGANHVS